MRKLTKKELKQLRKKNRKSFFEGYKNFIKKGNVVDLAAGVVIGTAFNAIVNSLVSDIIMPCVALIFGDQEFDYSIKVTDTISINYGNFINAIVHFLIISFTIYFVIKVVIRNDLNKKIKQRLQEIFNDDEVEVEKITEPLVVEEPKKTTEDLLQEIITILKDK